MRSVFRSLIPDWMDINTPSLFTVIASRTLLAVLHSNLHHQGLTHTDSGCYSDAMLPETFACLTSQYVKCSAVLCAFVYEPQLANHADCVSIC